MRGDTLRSLKGPLFKGNEILLEYGLKGNCEEKARGYARVEAKWDGLSELEEAIEETKKDMDSGTSCLGFKDKKPEWCEAFGVSQRETKERSDVAWNISFREIRLKLHLFGNKYFILS